jgi:hypothetical protein
MRQKTVENPVCATCADRASLTVDVRTRFAHDASGGVLSYFQMIDATKWVECDHT